MNRLRCSLVGTRKGVIMNVALDGKGHYWGATCAFGWVYCTLFYYLAPAVAERICRHERWQNVYSKPGWSVSERQWCRPLSNCFCHLLLMNQVLSTLRRPATVIQPLLRIRRIHQRVLKRHQPTQVCICHDVTHADAKTLHNSPSLHKKVIVIPLSTMGYTSIASVFR